MTSRIGQYELLRLIETIAMNSSQRIVLNTSTTYARSVLALGLALFSSRWVLNALGQTDFGLFNVVGSIIVFITFFSTVMAASVSRHFAYSIGQAGSEEVNCWFNTALSIHTSLAVGLVLIGWPIGENIIIHVLTIPEDRIPACLWVFRVSLVSAFFSIISCPFLAMFTAQQRITELSFWGMFQSILMFVLAYTITRASSDRLIFYAVGFVGVFVIIQVAQIFHAFILFHECRIVLHRWFDKYRLKNIFSFSIWNLIGSSGFIFRNQGSAILLNLFFGPTLNAAYGIANQVSGQSNQLAAAMIGAFSPEINVSEGRGDRKRMLSLSMRCCKLGTIMVMFFAIPLMVEMDYILRLWLREPPSYTAIFCQLILCSFLIDRLTTGYMLAVIAHGKIGAYQATVGTVHVLSLPLAWLFLKLGFAPPSVGVAFIITMTICSVARVMWARHLLRISIWQWMNDVVFPCVMMAVITVPVVFIPHWFMEPSFVRLLISTMSGVFCIGIFSWLFILSNNEQQFFIKNTVMVIEKFIGWRQEIVQKLVN